MNGKEEGTEKKKTAGKKKKNNPGPSTTTKMCHACGEWFESRFFSKNQWHRCKNDSRRCKNCVELKKKNPTVEDLIGLLSDHRDHSAAISALRSDHSAAISALRSDHSALRSDHSALRSDHSALRVEVDALKKSIQGIKSSFEPATIFALLEFFVYERVDHWFQSSTDLLYPVARVASRVLAELVTGSSSSAGPFSTITLTIKPVLTSFTASNRKKLARSCLEGLNMFVGLNQVNSSILQGWPPDRNIVCHDGALLNALHPPAAHLVTTFADSAQVQAMMGTPVVTFATLKDGFGLLFTKLGQKVLVTINQQTAFSNFCKIFSLTTVTAV